MRQSRRRDLAGHLGSGRVLDLVVWRHRYGTRAELTKISGSGDSRLNTNMTGNGHEWVPHPVVSVMAGQHLHLHPDDKRMHPIRWKVKVQGPLGWEIHGEVRD